MAKLILHLLIFITIGFCTCEALAQGNFHYVRDGANGKNDGSSWADAWDSLPSNLERGHTYYIAAGNYPNYVFDDPTSNQQYITIKKATDDDHGESVTWNSSYGAGQAIFKCPLRSKISLYFFEVPGFLKDRKQVEYPAELSRCAAHEELSLIVEFQQGKRYIFR